MSDLGGSGGRYVISDLADQDVLDIALYLARKGGAATSDRFVDRLFATFSLLAQSPLMGRSRDDLSSGIRSFPVGSYLVLYRLLEDSIEIARVVHGSRDLPALFGGPSSGSE